jgi:hypothetical protein
MSQASERHADECERRLAAEIVAMLRNVGVDARRVLTLVHAILNLTPAPQSSEPQRGEPHSRHA